MTMTTNGPERHQTSEVKGLYKRIRELEADIAHQKATIKTLQNYNIDLMESNKELKGRLEVWIDKARVAENRVLELIREQE